MQPTTASAGPTLTAQSASPEQLRAIAAQIRDDADREAANSARQRTTNTRLWIVATVATIIAGAVAGIGGVFSSAAVAGVGGVIAALGTAITQLLSPNERRRDHRDRAAAFAALAQHVEIALCSGDPITATQLNGWADELAAIRTGALRPEPPSGAT